MNGDQNQHDSNAVGAVLFLYPVLPIVRQSVSLEIHHVYHLGDVPLEDVLDVANPYLHDAQVDDAQTNRPSIYLGHQ